MIRFYNGRVIRPAIWSQTNAEELALALERTAAMLEAVADTPGLQTTRVFIRQGLASVRECVAAPPDGEQEALFEDGYVAAERRAFVEADRADRMTSALGREHARNTKLRRALDNSAALLSAIQTQIAARMPEVEAAIYNDNTR